MDVSNCIEENANGGDKMNNKDIKKLLKSHLDTQIPDVLSRIDLQSIEILDKPKPRMVYAIRSRFATLSLSLTAAIMLIIGLIAINNPPNSPIETPMTLTAEKTYSFSAISSSTLLNAIDIQVSQADQMILLSSMMQEETKIKQRVGLLNPYFNMIELFISSNQTLEFSEPVPSTMVGYTYQVSYQIINLNQDTATYIFHYNETQLDGNTITEGLLVLEQKQFYLEGTKTIDGETTTITTKTYQNPALKNTHYVEFISTEIQNTQWFEYHVYQSGERREKSIVRLETIGNTIRIRLDYENEIEDIEVELKATRIEVDGMAKINAEYEYKGDDFEEKGNIIVSVLIDPITNSNQYRYEITNQKGDKDDMMGDRGHRDYGRDRDDDDDDDRDDDDDHPGQSDDKK
jgi:hypothetical protein